MNETIRAFVEEARAVTIGEAAPRLGLRVLPRLKEHAQSCPVHGGTDTFAFNTAKNKWNCRQGGSGGNDAIGMAAHVLDLDVKRRDGLLEACAAVTGRDIPADGESETDQDRAARLARLDQARRDNAAKEKARIASANAFREKERAKARGIWESALPLATCPYIFGREYLRRRGCGVPGSGWLRVAQNLPYWHGSDERGQPQSLHSGPAMVAPFIALDDDEWVTIGCHITWIDLSNGPKFRPGLFARTPEGREAGRPSWGGDRTDPPSREDLDAGFYERLPTKKMRGSKKGGVIPLHGDPALARWLGAEGIENTLAFGRWEGFRADTFYFAAGDLGNLAGPAADRFAHPDLKKEDRVGRLRPIMVPGPTPRFSAGDEPDAMEVPAHVDELVLLADGDSERVMTAAAMVRAKARHARADRERPRLIPVVWPRAGTDFAAMLAGSDEAFR